MHGKGTESRKGPKDRVVLNFALDATDKYDLRTTYPLHPEGFAELMAGRTPITADRAEIPESLAHVLIGSPTAMEICWAK